MSLVGKPAPRFAAKAVVEGEVREFTLPTGKYVVLFFYPLDFTFVCPTELHAFQAKLPEFTARNALVVGCSVDSAHCHLAWLKTPKEQGGIQGVSYPLLSDLHKTISRAYGVLHEEEGVALRGLFLIDRKGVVRHQLVNDLPLGRNVDEALRVLDALQFHEEHGDVCPANWNQGQKTLKATSKGVVDYFAAKR
jgi:peroxiredoxin (alkyl hydroperoxide reductase subunit C)